MNLQELHLQEFHLHQYLFWKYFQIFDFQLFEDTLESAILTQKLERPKDEIMGKFEEKNFSNEFPLPAEMQNRQPELATYA